MGQHVIFEELAGSEITLGRIILNRPEALNALTPEMVNNITAQLQAWEHNPAIQAIIIMANGEKAFCAGGDIKLIYSLGKKHYQTACSFFQDEYILNHYIHNYSKCYISLLNGIAFGGGLGISIHGSHVVGTENLQLAMPETKIGLYPDIGASFFLSRCPGQLGMYLGLTGNTINIQDARYCQLVDYYVPSNKLEKLIEELSKLPKSNSIPQDITKLIHSFSLPTTNANFKNLHDVIQQSFAQDNVEDIIAALLQQDTDFTKQTAQQLQERSPTSLKITHQQLNLGKSMDIGACLQMEYHLTKKRLLHQDFYEGIRATVIDKKNNPNWQPDSLAKVTQDYIDSYFEQDADATIKFLVN